MPPSLLLAVALSAGADPTGSRPYPPAFVPPDTPYGFLYQPAFDTSLAVRLPARPYCPEPGDIILMSDTNLFWTSLYTLAGTGKPGHAGIVARMPDGRLGCLEAGYNDTLWTRFTPLDYRLNQYRGILWVRKPKVPFTPEQSARLTEFAAAAADTPYDKHRFFGQLTPFRSRGPIRTFFVGKPQGMAQKYICGEAVIEALVYAGVIDPHTARPRATYPQDMFYDQSPNIYLNRHPPLEAGWETPALWTPIVGVAAKGKEREQIGVMVMPEVPPRMRRRSFR